MTCNPRSAKIIGTKKKKEMVKQTIAQKILIDSIGNFNRDHPERKLGEIYLCNATFFDFYSNIGWKTKRLGSQAYTKSGKLISPSNNLFPVFIQAEEAEILDINLSKAVYPKEGN